MKKKIGKNTLGGGKKLSVNLKGYGRSSHDLSRAWRSSMGVGTLVPCLKEVALPGDTFEIAIDTKVLTHPTIGPLFGQYKMQIDLFTCPIRLYNALLHNNALNIGLDMSKVKLPKLQYGYDIKVNDMPKSSIHNYLGMRAIKASKKYNCSTFLMVYDIFKNYYANKQEEYFYVIDEKQDITNGTNKGRIQQTYLEWIDGENVAHITTDSNQEIAFESPDYGWENAEDVVGLEFQVLDIEGNAAAGIHPTWYRIASTKGVTITRNTGKYTIKLENAKCTTNDWSKKGSRIGNVVKIKYENPSQLKPIKLEELDTLREELLKKGREEVVFSKTNDFNLEIIKTLVATNEGGDTKLNTELYGLPIKTHQSDKFTNWINTEWIDGENGINAITAIDTSSGSFNIDTFYLSKKVYEMLNRIAVSGGSYKDWVETSYDTTFFYANETPIYEGGLSSIIDFQEVVSNSATEQEPLGTLAGRGYSSNKKGGELKIKVSEPSYIIGIASITPIVDYSQGLDWALELDNLGELHVPQLDGIGFQDMMQNWMHADVTDGKAMGKQPAWLNYMTAVNETYGNFAAEGNESFMVLNRVFKEDKGAIQNSTSYINPKDYTYIFAENSETSQDFWVQIGFGIRARRKMSAQMMPIL